MTGKRGRRFLQPALLAGLLLAAVCGDASTPAAQSAPVAIAATEKPKVDWTKVPIDELRQRAQASEPPAMEELGRRLISGVGLPRDPPEGAAWLRRAAEAGSASAAFAMGAMHERGFVLERDAVRAVDWYRKAADADLPAAKHNLALLLRDGKGAAQDGLKAVELLRAAARQGMTASMFALGDMYERGDALPKDLAAALAWFAIAAELEQQANHGTETALARSAQQRAEALQRVLTPAEIERAEKIGQQDFQQIVAALQPKPTPPPAPPPPVAQPQPKPAPHALPWPKGRVDQVRLVQQALIDLHHLHGKADGSLGPATRRAIRDFQRKAGLKETGEPSEALFESLKAARTKTDG